MKIGEQIRTIRKHLGLTQKELGQLSQTSESTIKQYESGARQPRLEQLQKIAYAFGGSVEDIFELEKPINLSTGGQAIIQMSVAGLEHIWNKEKRIVNEFNKLNEEGKDKAIEHVEMLAKIPEYRKEED